MEQGEIAQFISDLNVARFVDNLRLQRDLAIRTVLKKAIARRRTQVGL
jgi:hypothetical protein